MFQCLRVGPDAQLESVKCHGVSTLHFEQRMRTSVGMAIMILRFQYRRVPGMFLLAYFYFALVSWQSGSRRMLYLYDCPNDGTLRVTPFDAHLIPHSGTARLCHTPCDVRINFTCNSCRFVTSHTWIWSLLIFKVDTHIVFKILFSVCEICQIWNHVSRYMHISFSYYSIC